MASRGKPKVSLAYKAKPDISVNSATIRSKSITLDRSTTRGSQSSRSIIEAPPPTSRSQAISRLVAPSSTRIRSKSIEVSTPQPSRFFSKKGVVVGSSQQQSLVEPISSGVTRSKSINKSIEAPSIKSSIGGGPVRKGNYRPGPLRVSDL